MPQKTEVITEQKLETKEEGMQRLLPSRIIIQTITIEAGDDLNIWQPIERELHINIGPARIKEIFLDGRYSLILKYIDQINCYIEAYESELLDRQIFETLLDYTEGKIKNMETDVKKSIDREDIPEYQKVGLKLWVEFLIDEGLINDRFSEYLKIFTACRTQTIGSNN